MRDKTLKQVPQFDPPAWLRDVRHTWPWLLLGLVLLVTVFRTFVLVGSGERAVIFNRFTGTQQGQLDEGLHLLLPWVQSPALYDVRTQSYSMSNSPAADGATNARQSDALDALTSDGLPVQLDLSVLFHVDPGSVWVLHQQVGPEYLEKIVRPQVRSVVRMVVAQYPVINVYGAGRAKLIEEVNVQLKERLAQNHLVLDEALLRDVRFSPEFQAAIEKKQVAQQEVRRMAFVVEQADQERKRKIIEAMGEAEGIRLKASALNRNPQLVEYEYVKNLPDNVRTVVTDGRTLVNLGDALQPGPAAQADAAEGRGQHGR